MIALFFFWETKDRAALESFGNWVLSFLLTSAITGFLYWQIRRENLNSEFNREKDSKNSLYIHVFKKDDCYFFHSCQKAFCKSSLINITSISPPTHPNLISPLMLFLMHISDDQLPRSCFLLYGMWKINPLCYVWGGLVTSCFVTGASEWWDAGGERETLLTRQDRHSKKLIPSGLTCIVKTHRCRKSDYPDTKEVPPCQHPAERKTALHSIGMECYANH